jgi:exosome complex component RRP4
MAVALVSPGDIVATESGFLRGHGTYVRDGTLVASCAGVVERVNKLVSVVPLKRRYEGQVGDVIVGRVIEVGAKRWRVDIGSKQQAVLMLSSVHLPGGVQVAVL